MFNTQSCPFLFQIDFDEKWGYKGHSIMIWYGSYDYGTPSQFPSIVQKIDEPKCLTRGIRDMEELKEILSDMMLKTSERKLPETLEGL